MNLIQAVRDAGVVGAGGAGFPTHVKLSSKADTVIVNVAECEPLLKGDRQIAERFAGRLAKTLNEVMKTVSAETGVFAIKEKYEDAVEELRKETKDEKNVRVQILDDVYPVGDEHILVYEVTGRITPAGGIPLNVGVVVMNVETLLNISYALEGIPVTEKYVTVSGCVKNPCTQKFPVGTSMKRIIEISGGATSVEYEVIEGGPVMGGIVSADSPVTKTTNGILVVPKEHGIVDRKKATMSIVLKRGSSACDQCYFCTELCPRFLLGHPIEPHRIMRGIGHTEDYDTEVFLGALYCCECGVCDTFACNLDLSPRQVCVALKRRFAKAGIKPELKKAAEKVNPEREGRRIPSARISARLGVSSFDAPAPLCECSDEIDRVEFKLKQHIGVPAIPVVKTGDRVKKGDLVADIPADAVSARIHASIDGRITQVENDSIIIEK